MPALLKTNVSGVITWLGSVQNREATSASVQTTSLRARFDGVNNEDHGGLTRPSCGRVTSQYPRDTEIRNTRQLSILSQEELDDIAQAMALPVLDPALIGATMIITGIPDFSHIPPSSRLQTDSGTTFTVDMLNRPCHIPAKAINKVHPDTARAFKNAALHKRGVTAWVEREGPVSVGDTVTLHIPDQRAWSMTETILTGK
ncbi:MAG: MOSC domain-containing protein [Pseudoruegeria sp.]